MTSIRGTPVRASTSISRTFSAVGIDLGLVLEAVARADLADADAVGLMGSRNLYPRAMSTPVVLLAGGTGGAKLARGMLDEVGDELVVIANTGDDVEIHGGTSRPTPTS